MTLSPRPLLIHMRKQMRSGYTDGADWFFACGYTHRERADKRDSMSGVICTL